MIIKTAKIEEVTDILDTFGNPAVKLRFISEDFTYFWDYRSNHPADKRRLKELMCYTRAHALPELCGKTIRLVVCNGFFRAFGHFVKDKFVPNDTEEFVVAYKTNLEKVLATSPVSARLAKIL